MAGASEPTFIDWRRNYQNSQKLALGSRISYRRLGLKAYEPAKRA